ncbi:unnamed protein product [Paramecium sonneborni]|uniref:Transmembrane protein n=1 Tax=Paramecium sonneborni TaxID=65129 RepID=A0A8S1R819_9CILI|nr:unnamed protein product [Paramecium sonneborni]
MLKFQKKNKNLTQTCFKKVYGSMDLFGQPPAFKILKQEKFTTSLGFLFTVGISVVCILYTITQLEDLYSKTGPRVTMSEEQVVDTSAYSLEMKNYTIGITMTNLSLGSLQTLGTHFTMTVQNCKRVRSIDSTTNKTVVSQNCTVYPTEPCDNQHFLTDLQKAYFQKIKLGFVQCFNVEQWQKNPPQLQGTVQGTVYQYLQITIAQCKNTTNKTDCAPKENIWKELQSGYYAVHLIDNLVQMKNQGSPFQDIINLQYTTFSNVTSKSIFQSFQITQSKTDTGYIMEDIQTEYGLVQSQNRESQDYYNNQFIVQHIINLNSRQASYYREYSKLQDIFGNVGGLWQILFLAMSALLQPVTSNLMNLQMANKLFRFENYTNEEAQQSLDSQDENKENIKKSGSPTKVNVRSSQQFDLEIRKSYTSRRSLEKEKSVFVKSLDKVINNKQMIELLKKRKQSLNLSMKDIIIMSFGCKKKEKQLINYATDKFMNKLDIANLISKVYEIDRLKLILLSEQQQKLFNYLPKPIIPESIFGEDFLKKMRIEEQKQAYKVILQDEKPEFMKLQEAFVAYVKIQQKDEISEIDKKILDILDEDILDLFENLYSNTSKLENIFLDSPMKLQLQFSDIEHQTPLKELDKDQNEIQGPDNIDKCNQSQKNYESDFKEQQDYQSQLDHQNSEFKDDQDQNKFMENVSFQQEEQNKNNIDYENQSNKNENFLQDEKQQENQLQDVEKRKIQNNKKYQEIEKDRKEKEQRFREQQKKQMEDDLVNFELLMKEKQLEEETKKVEEKKKKQEFQAFQRKVQQNSLQTINKISILQPIQHQFKSNFINRIQISEDIQMNKKAQELVYKYNAERQELLEQFQLNLQESIDEKSSLFLTKNIKTIKEVQKYETNSNRNIQNSLKLNNQSSIGDLRNKKNESQFNL